MVACFELVDRYVEQLIEFLREKVFKDTEDKFTSYGTGEEGGDVLQKVIEKGEEGNR